MTPFSASDPTALLIAAIEAKTGLPAKRSGREYVVRCPAHDDNRPSGNIREGDGGYPVWQCRSHGCTMEQVLDSLGLRWSDIFGSADDRWTPRGAYTAVYDYVDEGGELLFQVCRTANKEFPQRRPNPEKASGWEWSLNGTRRVPFRLPKILQAAGAGEEVFIVEGEKDVLALERMGRIATCNPGGAGKWRAEYAPFFKGAHVLIVCDKDEVGLNHALAVADSVRGVAKSLRLFQPKAGKDVSDHLAAGHGIDALVPLDVAEAERSLETLTVSEQSEEAADEVVEAPRLRFLSGAEFRAQRLSNISPLVGTLEDAIVMPLSLTMVAGIGGSGKTTLVLHALAHWAAGLPWFGIETAEPIKILVIENEGPHDPFVRKLGDFANRFEDCMCSGEPHGGAHGIDENCLFLDYPWGKFSFDDMGLAEELRNTARGFGAHMVVANPLGRLGMRGAGAPEETREFVKLLNMAGLGDDFAALVIHHMAKANTQLPLIQQISGDWGPHADTIMVMEPAGERRSKLSFGKVRWGDQGRAPLVLDWLTNPDGPVGYKVQGASEFSDEQKMTIQQRIDSFLAGQGEPVGITAIKTAVKGKALQIMGALADGIETGRYQMTGGARPKYWLTAQGLIEDG